MFGVLRDYDYFNIYLGLSWLNPLVYLPPRLLNVLTVSVHKLNNLDVYLCFIKTPASNLHKYINEAQKIPQRKKNQIGKTIHLIYATSGTEAAYPSGAPPGF